MTAVWRTFKNKSFSSDDSRKGQFSRRKNPAANGFIGMTLFKPTFQNLTMTGRKVGGNDVGAEKPPSLIDNENQTANRSRIIDFYGGRYFHRGRQVTEPAGRIH